MKKSLTICSAVLFSCSTGAWAQSGDTMFATKAAGGGMAEVKLGQLAADKGSSDFVKQFGQRMVQDHSKANDDLKAVADKDNMTLPSDLDAKDQATYDRLSKMSGAAFDHAYLADMMKDHKMDIAEFQKESHTGKNADLKEFATRTLPTLQQHLQMLQQKKVM